MTESKLCGVLPVDKPAGWTSHDVVAKLRGRLHERRIGHGGTLDPMATGVLVVLVGKAARLMDLLPGTKRYEACLRFGFTSDTLDISGRVTASGQPLPSPAQAARALSAFRGPIMQIPPMMSALSKNGVRLYTLARQGIEVEREPRPAVISALDIMPLDAEKGEYTLFVTCSAGTYVRSLIDNLGRALDCGAVMTGLRRTAAGPYTLADTVSLEHASSEDLRPVETALPDIPAAELTKDELRILYQGKTLDLSADPRGADVQDGALLWLRQPEGGMAALGRRDGGRLKLFKSFS